MNGINFKKNWAKERVKNATRSIMCCCPKGKEMAQLAVVVRTRDKEQQLDSLLRILSNQTLRPAEVILINNFSSQPALATFREYMKKVSRFLKEKIAELKLVNIPDRDFSHPYSTNLGVFFAESELVSITNAHALPISIEWLDRGTRHFKNPRIACVTGYSFPFENNRSLAEIGRCVYYVTERIFLRFNWASTVNCIIRKPLWEEYPFDENLPKIISATKTYGCEDYDWSKEMEIRGYKTIVDPHFSVFHSHDRGLREAQRNVENYITQRRIQQLINKLERPRRACSRLDKRSEPPSKLLEEY